MKKITELCEGLKSEKQKPGQRESLEPKHSWRVGLCIRAMSFVILSILRRDQPISSIWKIKGICISGLSLLAKFKVSHNEMGLAFKDCKRYSGGK